MKKGFTLIEIVITISIIVLFAGLVLPRYATLNQESKLKQAANNLAETLELAKKKATTSELFDTMCTDFRGYRVFVDESSYSLFFACAGDHQLINEYAMEDNILAVDGRGDFDFPPAGFGVNLPINSITLENTTINKCVNISITNIGIITVSDDLGDC